MFFLYRGLESVDDRQDGPNRREGNLRNYVVLNDTLPAWRRPKESPLRKALLASVALIFLGGLAAPADAATRAPKSSRAEPVQDFGEMPKGPLQIVVSIANQHVTLYSNGVHVAQGPVSTGVPGRPTPTGVFSIIQKDRYHHSNLYSNAPMPFMERITWSGVALHEGPLPGFPASHGCIRMTRDFAARLWRITRLGVRVIVARTDVVPADFAHPLLFAPTGRPPEPLVAGIDPEKRAEALPLIKLAQSASETTGDGGAESAVTETRVQPIPSAEEAPVAAAEPTEIPAVSDLPKTGEAKNPPVPRLREAKPALAPSAGSEQPSEAAPATGASHALTVTDPPKPAPDVSDPNKAAPAKTKPSSQPAKRMGTVAVFVSRKEKKLYVRQGFAPLFEIPVEIEHPEQPLGTHVFTAMGFTDGGAGMRWNLMSMPPEPPREPALKKNRGRSEQPAVKPEVYPPSTAAQALDRIRIPQEAMDRIGEILVPGSSLVVSDQGLGPETGQGTEFIVLTR
jgi:hypothetical protein